MELIVTLSILSPLMPNTVKRFWPIKLLPYVVRLQADPGHVKVFPLLIKAVTIRIPVLDSVCGLNSTALKVNPGAEIVRLLINPDCARIALPAPGAPTRTEVDVKLIGTCATLFVNLWMVMPVSAVAVTPTTFTGLATRLPGAIKESARANPTRSNIAEAIPSILLLMVLLPLGNRLSAFFRPVTNSRFVRHIRACVIISQRNLSCRLERSPGMPRQQNDWHHTTPCHTVPIKHRSRPPPYRKMRLLTPFPVETNTGMLFSCHLA